MSTTPAPEAAAESERPPTQPGHRKALLTLIAVAVAVVVLDQVTKHLVVATVLPRMVDGQGPIELLGGWLTITYTENTGAAFSMGTGYTFLISLVAVAIVVVIITQARRLGSVAWAVALGGLLGGAVGNLIDRLTREPGIGRGYVVDFIQVPHFAVFNVADMCIVGSAALMVLLTLMGSNLRGGVQGRS